MAPPWEDVEHGARAPRRAFESLAIAALLVLVGLAATVGLVVVLEGALGRPGAALGALVGATAPVVLVVGWRVRGS